MSFFVISKNTFFTEHLQATASETSEYSTHFNAFCSSKPKFWRYIVFELIYRYIDIELTSWMKWNYENFHLYLLKNVISFESLKRYAVVINEFAIFNIFQIQHYIFIICLAPEFETCDRNWDKRGCYIGGSNFLPVMLKNYRNLIQWRNFEESIHR